MTAWKDNITVRNGRVIIDGHEADSGDSKEIVISIEGNINDLTVDSCNKIAVHGNVQSIKTGSGDISVVGDVLGSIKTGSGDIECGSVTGSISTGSGDITHR